MRVDPPHLTKPNRLTYVQLIEAGWPDFAAIKAFEIDVAGGIVRAVLKQRKTGSGSLHIIFGYLLNTSE